MRVSPKPFVGLLEAIALLCFFVHSASAQEPEPVESEAVESEPDKSEPADVNEELDEQLIDVDGSIGGAEERRGFSVNGDLRSSWFFSGDDLEDFEPDDSGALRARWRMRSIAGITKQLCAGIGVAGTCSTIECSPDAIFQPNIPTGSSIQDGQITIDSLFLHSFRLESFDLAVGRLQTKFVARGGVFSKSLDRNDSNGMNVNWTDGLHGPSGPVMVGNRT